MKGLGWVVLFAALALGAWLALRGKPASDVAGARSDSPGDRADGARSQAAPALAATIAGSVLVDGGLPPAELEVRCRLAGKTETARSRAAVRPSADPDRATFSLGGLPAGTASVELAVVNGPVLARFDGVELVAGERCPDPRLAEVDVRGLVKSVHVVVRDQGGEGINRAVVRARAREGEPAWSRVATEDGHATVCARALPIDFVCGASGFRTQRVEGASADFEVRLARGLEVELALDAGSLAFFGGDATLAVEYERGTLTSADDAVAWPELAKPGADGVARVRLCEPGLFRVELRASRRRDDRIEVFSAPCAPELIEVDDAREPQRFAITIAEPERAKLRAFQAP